MKIIQWAVTFIPIMLVIHAIYFMGKEWMWNTEKEPSMQEWGKFLTEHFVWVVWGIGVAAFFCVAFYWLYIPVLIVCLVWVLVGVQVITR